ncbi:MAG: hypothetical protein N3A66_08560 [Planctomycetota bacterium]|nr:hypothetical protein [Planctomycetota bacterium]
MAKVYTGSGKLFQELPAVPLDEEALRDMERRIKLQPHFLGEPLVVIGETRDFLPVIAPESHHLVALDALGRTVSVSLTAGTADVSHDLQALQLSAHLAHLQTEELGKIARSFIQRPPNEPLRRAWEEMEVEISDEAVELTSLLAAVFRRDTEHFAGIINQEQRIIIAAESFTSRLVDVISWLVRRGVHIIGLRYRKYMVGGQEVYFAEQVMPTQNPAVDAPEARKALREEALAPWVVKGRLHYLEHLSPAMGIKLDELLLLVKPATFAVHWSNKHYFWIRGLRRNLRIRTYFRDRLEVGFYNASPAMVQDILRQYNLPPLEVITASGYTDSPFIAITTETKLDERWGKMLNEWLSSAPGKEEREASRAAEANAKAAAPLGPGERAR